MPGSFSLSRLCLNTPLPQCAVPDISILPPKRKDWNLLGIRGKGEGRFY